MMIVCPTCSTSYNVQVASLGETGRSVRCVRCRTVWFASPPSALAEAAQPEAAVAARDDGTGGLPSGSAAASGGPAAARGEEDPQPAMNATDGGLPDDQAEKEAGEAPPRPEDLDEIAAHDAPPLAPADLDAAERERERAPPEPVQFDGEVKPAAPRRRWGPARLQARLPGRGSLRPRAGSPAMPPLALASLVMALLAVSAGLIAGRVQVVRLMPQTASFYALFGLKVNLKGLVFDDVKVAKEVQDNVPVLVLEGTITNTTLTVLEVPRLRFAMRDRHGVEVYTWTALPERAILGPGQTETFHTRLASPPPEGREVLIRFFGRGDAAGGSL